MAEIITKKFNAGTSSILKNEKYGSNWPVVYIINNKEEAYVGETTDAIVADSKSTVIFNTTEKEIVSKWKAIVKTTGNTDSFEDTNTFAILFYLQFFLYLLCSFLHFPLA